MECKEGRASPWGAPWRRGPVPHRRKGGFWGAGGCFMHKRQGRCSKGGEGAACCPPAPNMEPEGSPRGPAHCRGGTYPDPAHQQALLQAGGVGKAFGVGTPRGRGTPRCPGHPRVWAGRNQAAIPAGKAESKGGGGGCTPTRDPLGSTKEGGGRTHTMQGGPRASRDDTSTPNPHRAPPGAATSAAQSFSLPAI